MKFFADCQFAPCSATDRLIVRHGLETIWKHTLYRESFAPDAWLNEAEPVPVRIGHDGPTIGHVTLLVAHGRWHHASFVVDDGPLQTRARELVKRGAKVSPGFYSLSRREDTDLRLVRHTIARLDEIALLQPGDVPGYIGAVITDVWVPKPKRSVTVDGVELHPGDELLGVGDRVIARCELDADGGAVLVR